MPHTARAHRVYVRQLWSQDWTLVEQLYADAVTFTCAPEIPRAVLHYNYGQVVPFGEVAWSTRGAQEILDWYVKIEIDQPDAATLDWYGVLKFDQTQLRGDAGAAANTPSGVQRMTAYGLEYLLHRTTVDSATVTLDGGWERTINRGLGFNLGGTDGTNRYRPNMELVPGFKGTQIFTKGARGGNPWTPASIVRYLLAYHSPRDGFGIAQLPFKVDPLYLDQLRSLTYWTPTLPSHGRSVKELLDALMTRQRLMSYHLVVSPADEGSDQILLRPFTFAEADIDLPTDGRQIKANLDQATWNFDRDVRVKSAVVVRDTQQTYDVVTIRSERAGVVWTAEHLESLGPLVVPDWESTLQVEYNAGSPAAADAAEDYAKIQLHRAYRLTDKFERCYRYFKISPEWDGRWISTNVVYDVTSEANPLPAGEFWYPGLRFESYLPLVADVDYTTVSANPLSVAPDGSPSPFRRPFAVLTWEDQNSASKYMRLDKPRPAEYFAAHPEQTERKWSVRLQPQRDLLGMILDVSGAPQHVIASEEFEAADDADEADWPAEFDWRSIRWTAYMLLDDFARGQYPDPLPPSPLDVERRLVLDVPGKHLDYILPFTILDVDAEGNLIESEGGFVRDDRQELKDLARLTHGWYATERRSLEVTRHTLDVDQVIGTLITTIGSGATLLEVNSVVTQIDLDLRQSLSTVRTQFAEFDIRGM